MAATLTASGVNFSDGSTINGTAVNSIGSYAFAGLISQGTYNVGSTVAGTSLRPASMEVRGAASWPGSLSSQTLYAGGQNTTFAGTWRCMGWAYNAVSGACCINWTAATLWVRIS